MAGRWRGWLVLLLAGVGAGCSDHVTAPASTSRPVAGGHPKTATARDLAPQPPPKSGVATSSPFVFQDVAAEAGISFLHHSPLSEQRHTHLTYGSGLGWFDYDRDGWPDLYCAQGRTYRPGLPAGEAPPDSDPSDMLFLNRQNGTFVDVTQAAGLVEAVYSMGVAAADYDNDGFPDLCVTGYDENVLYRNNGDGTFCKQTLPEGQSPGRLSSSCTWADIDADGNLDLYIANYARLGPEPENYPLCTHTEGGKTLYIDCHPCMLQALPDTLYRNGPDGQFEDVSVKAGVTAPSARCGLGVIAADLDEDGDVDLYVSNDTTPNFLWENQGDGTLVDRGVVAGAAFNCYGACEAGMSLEAADFTGDGRFDLFVTNFFHETNTFYRNEGGLLFSDVTPATGLGAPSKLRLGFGTVGLDFDRDTFLDLFVANGHVHDRLHEINRDEPFAQLPLLFHNERGVRFSDVSAGSGRYFTEPHVGRGAAAADFDRDGDADMAVNHLNGQAALLRNETQPAGGWLQIELIGTSSNRSGIGAVLAIDLGRQQLVRTRQAGTGYCSCGEERMLIGVGDAKIVTSVSIRWPSGLQESWNDLPVNSFQHLVEGTGHRSPLAPREESRSSPSPQGKGSDVQNSVLADGTSSYMDRFCSAKIEFCTSEPGNTMSTDGN